MAAKLTEPQIERLFYLYFVKRWKITRCAADIPCDRGVGAEYIHTEARRRNLEKEPDLRDCVRHIAVIRWLAIVMAALKVLLSIPHETVVALANITPQQLTDIAALARTLRAHCEMPHATPTQVAALAEEEAAQRDDAQAIENAKRGRCIRCREWTSSLHIPTAIQLLCTKCVRECVKEAKKIPVPA